MNEQRRCRKLGGMDNKISQLNNEFKKLKRKRQKTKEKCYNVNIMEENEQTGNDKLTFTLLAIPSMFRVPWVLVLIVFMGLN